jgi:Protein of unknown function (DUF3168)
MPSPAISASLALQAAIFAALTANADVTALVGTARIFDDVPPNTPYPYVTFGQTTERDWSTSTEPGSEHTLTLHVWSKERGRRQAHRIGVALRAALVDTPLILVGHRLINLRHEFSETRREGDGETYRAIVRFRAVTEPL